MSESFAIVGLFLGLLVCTPWIIKLVKQRVQHGAAEAGGQVKFVSALAVGPHQRVVTVEVGPEQARVWLTLGVTAQAVTCLHSVACMPTAKEVVPQKPMDSFHESQSHVN